MARRTRRRLGLVTLLLLALALSVFSPGSAAVQPLPATGGELSVDFHADSCPQLEAIVSSAVHDALRQNVHLTAGLLRIYFHDCFPQGCDASVLLKGDGSEQSMGPNTTLQPRALQLIEDIRAEVHDACGPTVSCADITALATRDAVVASGGPSYAVHLGHLDSLAPASGEDVGDLPSPTTASVHALLDAFSSRGLNKTGDLVSLSGAHTVGKARCVSFADRAARGGDTFAKKLAANCSRDHNRLQNLDVRTPDAFDNAYFVDLTFNQGVFTSDMALVKNHSTARFVTKFAKSKDAFFARFAKSMVKLSRVPRKPAGNVGEIRRNCFRTNAQTILDGVVDDASGERLAA
ncbi:hypothetical protein ACP70R_010648 [Stipagrostis hirtigluma subsp. patula]